MFPLSPFFVSEYSISFRKKTGIMKQKTEEVPPDLVALFPSLLPTPLPLAEAPVQGYAQLLLGNKPVHFYCFQAIQKSKDYRHAPHVDSFSSPLQKQRFQNKSRKFRGEKEDERNEICGKGLKRGNHPLVNLPIKATKSQRDRNLMLLKV